MLSLTPFLEHSSFWDPFPAVQVLHSPLPAPEPCCRHPFLSSDFPKGRKQVAASSLASVKCLSKPLENNTLPEALSPPFLQADQHQFLLLPWEHPLLCQRSAFRFAAPGDTRSGGCQQRGSAPSTWQKPYRESPTSPHLSISDKSSPTETARISHQQLCLCSEELGQNTDFYIHTCVCNVQVPVPAAK